jgi:DNA-binding GntR family transcriptional regulator
MASAQTKRADAAESVLSQVRQGIISGEYAPGSRLIETQIADALEVSRTPVREALVRLAAEGFVELIRNRGAFVVRWSEEDLEEIFGLRVLLEGYGLRIAATKITPREIEELEELAERMDRTLAAQGPRYAEECTDLNTSFHGMLVGAAGNKRLSTMVAQLTQLPLIHRTISLQAPQELASSFAQHHEMVAAMRRRDGEWAEALMRAHILAGRDVMRRAFSEEQAAG